PEPPLEPRAAPLDVDTRGMRRALQHRERAADVLAPPLDDLGELDEPAILRWELARVARPGLGDELPLVEPPQDARHLAEELAADRRRAGHLERPRVERDGALGSVEEEALSRRRAQLGGVLGEAQRIIEDPKDGEEEPGGPDDVLAVVPDDGGQCRGIAAA